MKTLLRISAAVMFLMFAVTATSVTAQDNDTPDSKSYVKIKTMKIENGDTIVTEKEYSGDGDMQIEDSIGGSTFGNFQFKSFNNPFDTSFYNNFSRMQDMFGGFNPGLNNFFFNDFDFPEFRFPQMSFDVDSVIKQFSFNGADSLFPSPGDNKVIIKSYKDKQDSSWDSRNNSKQKPDMDMHIFGRNDKGQPVTFTKKITVLENGVNGKKQSTEELPVEVFPNPADMFFNVSFQLDPYSKTNIQITDINGKVMLKETLEKSGGNYTRQIDMKDYARGAYLISIKQGKKFVSRQIIIE